MITNALRKSASASCRTNTSTATWDLWELQAHTSSSILLQASEWAGASKHPHIHAASVWAHWNWWNSPAPPAKQKNTDRHKNQRGYAWLEGLEVLDMHIPTPNSWCASDKNNRFTSSDPHTGHLEEGQKACVYYITTVTTTVSTTQPQGAARSIMEVDLEDHFPLHGGVCSASTGCLFIMSSL